MRYNICLSAFACILVCCLLCGQRSVAQIQQPPGAAPTLNNIPQRDTSLNKTNNSDWHDETSRTTFHRAYSELTYIPDTTLHTFHRRPFIQPWYHSLGNHGTSAMNWFFTPEYRVGPTLGYHTSDIYRFDVDSLFYYNTNRPYTNFTYQVGSKLEQTAQILHTQNIRPNWNFAAQYQKITSPGTFLLQRTNHDNGWLTTHYQSPKLHYQLYAAFAYNKEQQDENGGIIDETQLDSNDVYGDRRTVPIRFGNASLGSVGDYQRSAISNMQRDVSFLLQHSYAFGRVDTIYNEDSTRYTFEMKPRFGLSHRLQILSEKHLYKDMRADSLRYADFFHHSFNNNGKDSVLSEQKWRMVDNRIMLNSFIGKQENLLTFSAGLGNRLDKFNTYFIKSNNTNNIISNYAIGELKKEIRLLGQWFYNANAIVYLTGDAAGSSMLQAGAGKNLGEKWGNISAGFSQHINTAPYSYTTYYNQYDTILTTFNKESITQLSAMYDNSRLKLGGGIRNYLIGNYIYLNEKQLPDQNTASFNITQLWLRKIFTWRVFVLDNELVYQQTGANAKVNIPATMGRHQLSVEAHLFKSALAIATGIQVQYHSAFNPAGYSPVLNRFYYQDSYYLTNAPQSSVFFNFRIKQFRAYLMGDQIQKLLFDRNVINYPGYPMPDFSFRVGFSWTLIN